MRRTLCIILLCLGCLVASTIYAEEWIFEKEIPYPYLISIYVQKPIVSEDKKAIIFKFKAVFPSGEASYYDDIVDIEHGYYYSSYQKRSRPYKGAKKYTTYKKDLSLYRDEDILIIPDSEREDRVKAACKELGLPVFRDNKKYNWRWIYSTRHDNYFVCKNGCYFSKEKEAIWIFLKIGIPSKELEQLEPRTAFVDFHNHRIKVFGYGDWKTVTADTWEEAVYNAAEKIYKKILEEEKESTNSIQHK